MPGATRTYMGLGRVYCVCIILEIAVMNVRTSIAPLPMRSYVGLGLGYSCVILEHGNRNINMCDMLIAPLPIRSYVGLGLGSRDDVMYVHR